MSSLAHSFGQELVRPVRYAVSYRTLLSLYTIIPLCLLIQLGDTYWYDGALKNALPSSPNHFVLFQLLFGIPHILASAILLTSNREYLSFYRHKLLLMTLFIVVFFGVGSLFIPYKALYILTAAWTVFHVLKQQLGIGRGVYPLPNWTCHILLGLSVSAGIAIYIGIFLKNHLTLTQATYLHASAFWLCVGLLLITLVSQRYVPSLMGKTFLWGNSCLVFSSFYLAMCQYYFLAILVPRLVHDATAFIVYVTHDYNRQEQQQANALYRWMAQWHIPVFLMLPSLAFGSAFILQNYGDAFISNVSRYVFDVEIRKAVTLGVIGYLSLMHYYTESFTWKHDSPYRRYIAFKR